MVWAVFSTDANVSLLVAALDSNLPHSEKGMGFWQMFCGS